MPPYSPDINVIELVWAELKRFLRKKKLQTKEDIVARVQKFYDEVLTVDKCRAYIGRIHTVIIDFFSFFVIFIFVLIYFILLGSPKNH